MVCLTLLEADVRGEPPFSPGCLLLAAPGQVPRYAAGLAAGWHNKFGLRFGDPAGCEEAQIVVALGADMPTDKIIKV